jgi:protocatechuate 3,4-dioxygenase beta subunit
VFGGQNLDPGATNDILDGTYIRDRHNRTTKRITGKLTIPFFPNACESYQTIQYYAPKKYSMSPDGRFVTFAAETYCYSPGEINRPLRTYFYLLDRDTNLNGVFDETGKTSFKIIDLLFNVVYPYGFEYGESSISADGRFILFNTGSRDPRCTIKPGLYLHDRGTSLSFAVSGRVVDAEGSPIPGVAVDIGGGRTAFTDASGFYSLQGLPGGTYYLRPASSELEFSPASRAVVVPPSASGQDFTVVSGFTPLSSLSGRVTDVFNQPLAGALVSDGQGHETLTDENGYYAFSDLEAGTYSLSAALPGYALFPSTISMDLRGETISGLNFTGIRVFSISGRVTLPDDSGLAGVLIATNLGAEALTDEEGYFTLEDIPAGGYTLTASKDGYSMYPEWKYVEVREGNAAGLHFLAEPQ